jgi:hypothetical protein
MSLGYCTSKRKEGECAESPDLEELNLPITRQHRKPITKSDLMKSIVSYSAVLTPSRFVGFVAVMALAALPGKEEDRFYGLSSKISG